MWNFELLTADRCLLFWAVRDRITNILFCVSYRVRIRFNEKYHDRKNHDAGGILNGKYCNRREDIILSVVN